MFILFFYFLFIYLQSLLLNAPKTKHVFKQRLKLTTFVDVALHILPVLYNVTVVRLLLRAHNVLTRKCTYRLEYTPVIQSVESPDEYPSSSSTPIGRRGSYKTGRGPRLYKQPATKSNRGIILNAVEYCVFPGAVNRDAKQKVLEKIARSEAKHFLVLFRDAGCQFRALYGYWPENEQIIKLYGTGPSQVDDVMFDKFFKYNSGGKCFTQVHTKHLTVTIDAFTIHNSLWQGKKANLPSKKDMALVI